MWALQSLRKLLSNSSAVELFSSSLILELSEGTSRSHSASVNSLPSNCMAYFAYLIIYISLPVLRGCKRSVFLIVMVFCIF